MEFASEEIYIKKDNDFYFNTNIINLNFNELNKKQNKYLMFGSPFLCKNCESGFNMYSKFKNSEKTLKEEFKSNELLEREWKCEFCEFTNNINIDYEEVPINEDCFYFLENTIV